MKIEHLPINKLKPNPDNPRFIRDEKFKSLVKSLEDCPDLFEARPCICSDRTGELIIIGGNMRWRAARELKWKEVPVIIMPGLAEAQEKEIAIKDNGDFGEWDFDVLANSWGDLPLDDWGVDLPADWAAPIEPEEPADAEPQIDRAAELNKEWGVKTGDLWLIGEHRLLCGDSTKAEDVGRLMGGERADMVFTDPPYGVSYVGKTKDALQIENDDFSGAELDALICGIFDGVTLSCRKGAYVLATVPARPLHVQFASDWLRRGWLRQILVWNKDSMVLGHSEYHYKHEPILFGWIPGGDRLKNDDRTKTTVWDFDRPKASREHPTMKPIDMWVYGIGNHTQQGGLLYEPCLGSGTTMVAAHNLGRKCYGIEISPDYCAVILQRMKDAFPEIEIKRAKT